MYVSKLLHLSILLLLLRVWVFIHVCLCVSKGLKKDKFPVNVCTLFPVVPECDATNITGAVGEL